MLKKSLVSIFILLFSISNIHAQTAPEICMVRVIRQDSTEYNLITWDHNQRDSVHHYNIYKKNHIDNIFVKIGEKTIKEYSSFIDYTSSPDKHSDEYKISIVDSNSIESPISQSHKTMHLLVVNGINGEKNLVWDGYSGFSFSMYYILRGPSIDSMYVLDSITNGFSTYTDLTPNPKHCMYQITCRPPTTCYPSKATEKGPYASSTSNIKSYCELTSIYNHDFQVFNAFIIYPNPARENIIIKTNTDVAKEPIVIEISNAIGQVVLKSKKHPINQVFSIENLENGMYFIKIKSQQGEISKKFCKVE